jgi:transposase-like protein
MSVAEVRRRHYGIAEIADALGLNRQLVTVWRRRRSWGMPEPDDELASGPLWLGSTVEPWIDAVRARLGEQSAAAGQLGPELIRRAGRRLLRLAALLLEDTPRPSLVVRAYAELGEVVDAVRDCAAGADRELLLAALERVMSHPGSDDGQPAPSADLAASCLAALAEVVPLLRRTG